MEERKTWTRAEYDNIERELNSGVPIEIVSQKYRRTVDAIRRKFYRGYDNQRTINKLKYFNNENQLKQFMIEYQDININTKDLMNKYHIETKEKLYDVVRELGVYRNRAY